MRKWPVVLGVVALAIGMALAAFALRRKPNRAFIEMLAYAAGNAALLVMLGRMAGPFTFVPAVACFMVMSVMSYPAFVQRPWALIAMILAGFVAPLVLEAFGLLPMTWELRDGTLVSHAGALQLEGNASVTMVIVASFITIVFAGVHAANLSRSSREAHRQLVMQTWHLRQLLPAS